MDSSADNASVSTTKFLARFFTSTIQAVELRALPSKTRRFTRKQNEAEKFIRERAHENVYFGVTTRKGGGDKFHCRELIALWVDVDFKTTSEQQARDLLNSFPHRPSIVIESGGGLHVYWLLETPIDAHDDRIEPILRGLAAALGADSAAAEIARVMRLPGTYNHKYDPPRECRVVEVDWDRRSTLTSFEHFAAPNKQAPRQATNGTTEKIVDGHRNAKLTSIAGQMRHNGMNEDEIRDALLSINARRCNPPLPQSEVEGVAKSVGRYPSQPSAVRTSINPWTLAIGMDMFLVGEDAPVEFMFPRIIVTGAVTEIFSPRGLGKSLWAIYIAVLLAKAGHKVLLIDRDNPRRIVKERLRAFGATTDLSTLKFLSRECAPPLTDTAAWREFPYADFDLVILDAMDSAAEGIGEQDSAKPSRAIAPILDLAHREYGPAVLVLGNCIKSGAHSRGSGVIEDRADIVFEVRDATNFHPTGKKPWVEELPAVGAGNWVSRSARRKQLEKYRLAFIATKFRIGEEPEPFILEIDLTTEPWSVRDVTDDVDREGAAERERQAQARAAVVQSAVELLRSEILRREAVREAALLKKQAEEFLASCGIKQKIAREAVKSAVFQTTDIAGKGHPKVVRLAAENNTDNRNTTSMEPSIHAGSERRDFGQPHPERSTEMESQHDQCLRDFQCGVISVEDLSSTSTSSTETCSDESTGSSEEGEI